MIRPIDIQEKEFGRAVRGYKEDDVNQFLDEITVDLERLLSELRTVKEENSRLVEELEAFAHRHLFSHRSQQFAVSIHFFHKKTSHTFGIIFYVITLYMRGVFSFKFTLRSRP